MTKVSRSGSIRPQQRESPGTREYAALFMGGKENQNVERAAEPQATFAPPRSEQISVDDMSALSDSNHTNHTPTFHNIVVQCDGNSSPLKAQSLTIDYQKRSLQLYNEATPSSEDGPPFSANAIRDRSQLPLEISCIVGSYVATCLILGTLLLTVGRRLRRQALEGGTNPVKPAKGPFEASPTSPPMNDRKWYSSVKHLRKASGSARSPVIDSVASFDAKVVEHDKQTRQDELEKLYAVALAHDEILKNDATVSETELIERRDDFDGVDNPTVPQPLRVVTDVPSREYARSNKSPVNTISPMSPVRAIYPPDVEMPPVPQTSTSPIRAEYPRRGPSPRHGSVKDEAEIVRAQSPANTGVGVGAPHKKTKRFPMHINIVDARLPLTREASSSRTPGIAPQPDEQPASARSDSVPSTPGTYTSRRRASAARERDSDIGMNPSTPSPMTSRFHENNPYRHFSPTYPPVTQVSSPRIRLDNHPHSPSAGMLSPSLPSGLPQSPRSPFHAPPARQQAPQQTDTLASTGTIGALPLRPSGPLSPAQTRTTYLERRRDMLYPGLRTGGGMRSAQHTGGLATPYSPYMPFTPITPVTPMLVTRAERERRRREEGRRAVTEEDAVQEDGEVWGS